ncbi:phosphopeptide-binding protein [Pseudoclavibacter endophyticus]|uniref:DUF2662 domain-containing protein n=1 Tax=Pseudoclavibacter endophyticus TaxID=1778590 RepID=A0A6H9WCR0_9MICO|nr:DUF3662 and FHA domain-containing protein [Pseudoclavibacter endophyticus]KAB1648739.1 DUF2662 domain-containing protein [Pseudoclavibacter endophyticus]GGA68930.1 phosphopeptide-binding protein [Pseudoclavibacter endophyticus]
MGILDRLERGLERLFNGAFAKTFRSGLQPVEITAALKRELDTRAQVVTRDRILAPNRFHVLLNPADYERMSSHGSALTDELYRVVERHAQQQGYQFTGGLSIKLLEDDSISVGRCEIESRSVQGQVVWTPVLDVDGERFHLRVGSTTIGRGAEADITLAGSGASRRHAEVVWDGQRAGIRDLGSTNGTLLAGRRVSRATLEPDAVIEIAGQRLIFRVVPQAPPSDETGFIPSQRGRQ